MTRSAKSAPPIPVPPPRTTPPLLMSLVLHVVVLTSIGLILARESKGTQGSDDRPVGIALVHRLPDRTEYVDVTETLENPTENANAQSTDASAAAPPADLTPPIDLSAVLQSIASTPNPAAASGLAGETNLDGAAFGAGRGSTAASDPTDTTATVFGVSGSGSRFIYVFDRSDSMNGFGGKPLRAAKTELIRSLRTLNERQRFQIIFYNEKPSAFRLGGTAPQMVAGEDTILAQAESFVQSVAAFGGTEHGTALKMALRMGPDVVFFLTDARIPRLSVSELRDIKNRADGVGATIHAIEFGAEPVASPDSFLRELAAMNRGEYRYIDIRRFGQVNK